MSRPLAWLLGGLILLGLFLTSRYSFLLFHTLGELFSVAIGCGIFMMAWTARRLLQNNYLLLIGTASLAIAVLDLAHTLAYKGMGVFPALDANPPTQLWIAARFLEAFSLLLAPMLLRRKLHPSLVLLAYGIVTALVLLSIFHWRIFPDCFIEGRGLTPFKRTSEYVICVILLAAMALLWFHRASFDPGVLRLLLWATGFTVCSELAFTTYVGVYDAANALGHIFKIIAFFLVYKAIIESGLTKPHTLLLRQLSLSEERYRHLFDLSPDGIFALDPDGRFLMVNPAFEQLTGYSRDELRGRAFQDLLVPGSPDAFPNLLQPSGRESHAQFEAALLRRDAQPLDVWVAGKPLMAEGKPTAIHCTVRDISERKRFQSELERLVRERTAKLQELVDELEHFSYSITHDMRAPLRAMRGFADMLQESCGESLNEEQKSYLRKIMTSSGRMDRLITDALQYSKAVRKELACGPVDLQALLEGMLDSYPDLQPPRAVITIEKPLPRVLANEAGLTQCFSNLLSNAVKFVENGTTPKVRVWAERKRADPGTSHAHSAAFNDARHPGLPCAGPAPEVVRIWVEDNGIGIPAHAQGRLFKMFQRLSNNYEGNGIGLALVRKVTERMGGRSGLESEPGKGSRFWVEFSAAEEHRQRTERRT